MGKNEWCMIWSEETAKLGRKIKGHVGHKKETSELEDSASDVGQAREVALALWWDEAQAFTLSEAIRA